MNKNINNMIDSVISGNKEEFSSSFASEIRDRIDSDLINKRLNISKNIMNTDNPTDGVHMEEGKNVSSEYTFKNSRDASTFVKAANESGIRKQNITVKNKTVKVLNVDPNMMEILDFLAKDMKAIRK
tara:strand:- start:34 stop:414 length:381 start_codon:yes stop_codon:yes gene_type:complete